MVAFVALEQILLRTLTRRIAEIMNVFLRWIRFNAVGAVGVTVQLSTLAVLVHLFEVHYILATALAVETAILHNFVWHEKWTWSDIAAQENSSWVGRLIRFHITNGFTSLGGNLILMQSLVGTFQLPVLYANLIAIAACSLINFMLSNYWVFQDHGTSRMPTE
jgi:putative flippase GtrA